MARRTTRAAIRAAIVRALRDVAADLRITITRWTILTTQTKPEDDLVELRRLARSLDDMAAVLVDQAAYARRQAAELDRLTSKP